VDQPACSTFIDRGHPTFATFRVDHSAVPKKLKKKIMSAFGFKLRSLVVIIAAAVGALLMGSPGIAVAQQIAALVNGEPITALDVAQRHKLMQLSGAKDPSSKAALDELIDEKLKLQTAKRYKVDVTDAEVDSTFNTLARRSRGTPEQFSDALKQAGISVESFKARIRADIGWQQIVRGKFRENFQIRERDVFAAVQSRNKDEQEAVGYEYSLRPILLIVPRGSPPTAFEARRHEADGLRTRFQDCEQGIRLARALKDVAVRPALSRTSADFNAHLRDILEKTQVGRLTPPEQTAQGIELFAVCAKKQVAGALPGRREVQDEMIQERFDAQGKRYLQELRRGAMIEYR
jgi:peptidyl-prolyl cis-trans isomerase SurA